MNIISATRHAAAGFLIRRKGWHDALTFQSVRGQASEALLFPGGVDPKFTEEDLTAYDWESGPHGVHDEPGFTKAVPEPPKTKFEAEGADAFNRNPCVELPTLEEPPTDRPQSAVDHPSHYGGGDNPYEVIRVLRAWGLDKNFCLGNVIKYVARAGKKDPAKLIEDLEKAKWYLEDEIKALKEQSK